jgi:hypothetical protein
VTEAPGALKDSANGISGRNFSRIDEGVLRLPAPLFDDLVGQRDLLRASIGAVDRPVVDDVVFRGNSADTLKGGPAERCCRADHPGGVESTGWSVRCAIDTSEPACVRIAILGRLVADREARRVSGRIHG